MTLNQKTGRAGAPGRDGFRRDGGGKSGSRSDSRSDSREFFRIGAQLGIPWYRLYLADSLAQKYGQADSAGPAEVQDSARVRAEEQPGDASSGRRAGSLPAENLRWFILHLAVQAGRGHLRHDLENFEDEFGQWYSADGFRTASPGEGVPKGFDENLPAELAQRVPALVEAGLVSGLIGQLPEEDSPGESLDVPRPPLVLSSDGRFIYFLRRRKEEDRFLAALESRCLPGDRTAGVPGTEGSESAAELPAGIGGGEADSPHPELTVHPAFSTALSRMGSGASGVSGSPEGALLRGLATGKRLLILAGGPGTGKTTTVARLLELLNPRPGSLEVLLAAPTGRAAARMSESLQLADDTAGRTIHSLLGLYPGRPPRHDADRPLAADLCIVDEASMVDLPLMNALLAALPENAALLLVGDPDQLPSVEAGAVLGDLLYGAAEAAGKGVGEGDAAGGGAAPPAAGVPGGGSAEAARRGESIPGEKTSSRSGEALSRRRSPRRKGPLAGAVVKLTKVYRSDTAILEAAAALREGDSETLKKLLEEDEGAVRLYPPGSPDSMARLIAREFRESAARGAQPVQFSDDENTEGIPDEIRGLFDDFSSRAVLSPLRRGEWGVPAMNERISRLLGGTASPFPGMPVMITRNDPERKLWNGDRGILVSIDGKLRAAFPEAGGARSFPLAALPGWEPAWVQTIHKSQGSEFDSVTVLLPRGAERLLSREILYTAFTRARHTVNLHAEFETVEAALERRVVRHSRIRNWAAGG